MDEVAPRWSGGLVGTAGPLDGVVAAGTDSRRLTMRTFAILPRAFVRASVNPSRLSAVSGGCPCTI